MGDVFWEEDGLTVVCGDSLTTTFPPADLVIADPPYGIAYRSNRRLSGKTDPIEGDDAISDEWLDRLVFKIPHSAIYLFTRWDVSGQWQEILGRFVPKVRNQIVWHKTTRGPGDLERTYAPDHELILFGSWGDHRLDHRYGDVWRFTPPKGVEHPTPKPLALMERIVLNSSKPGDMVVDPFMGSGPVAEACKKHGRQYFGVEREERWCQLVADRLGQGVLPLY